MQDVRGPRGQVRFRRSSNIWTVTEELDDEKVGQSDWCATAANNGPKGHYCAQNCSCEVGPWRAISRDYGVRRISFRSDGALWRDRESLREEGRGPAHQPQYADGAAAKRVRPARPDYDGKAVLLLVRYGIKK